MCSQISCDQNCFTNIMFYVYVEKIIKSLEFINYNDTVGSWDYFYIYVNIYSEENLYVYLN